MLKYIQSVIYPCPIGNIIEIDSNLTQDKIRFSQQLKSSNIQLLGDDTIKKYIGKIGKIYTDTIFRFYQQSNANSIQFSVIFNYSNSGSFGFGLMNASKSYDFDDLDSIDSFSIFISNNLTVNGGTLSNESQQILKNNTQYDFILDFRQNILQISSSDLLYSSQPMPNGVYRFFIESNPRNAYSLILNLPNLNQNFPSAILQCSSCEYACKNCIDSQSCTYCSQGSFLETKQCCHSNSKNNLCQSDCPILSGFMYQGSCLERCPIGYNYDSNLGYCTECDNKCRTCQDGYSSQCLTCSSNQVLYQQQCLNQCPYGTVFDPLENECVLCVNCLTCSGTQTYCTSCSIKKILYQGKCIDECPDGLYFSEILKTCLPCQENCETCMYSPVICTSCKIQQTKLYLYQGSCWKICPRGTYQNQNNYTCCQYVQDNSIQSTSQNFSDDEDQDIALLQFIIIITTIFIIICLIFMYFGCKHKQHLTKELIYLASKPNEQQMQQMQNLENNLKKQKLNIQNEGQIIQSLTDSMQNLNQIIQNLEQSVPIQQLSTQLVQYDINHQNSESFIELETKFNQIKLQVLADIQIKKQQILQNIKAHNINQLIQEDEQKENHVLLDKIQGLHSHKNQQLQSDILYINEQIEIVQQQKSEILQKFDILQQLNNEIQTKLRDIQNNHQVKQANIQQLIQQNINLKSEIQDNKIECKVCMDSIPNVLIKPCRHLICDSCFESWCQVNSNLCPFCKQNIDQTEQIDFLTFN